MKKKGEKSLQMIFGLFLLLIISLVVLSMFFKFVAKGSSETSTAAEDYTKSAAIDKAITECENLCREANDIASKIEFCSTIYEVDWDKDGSIEGSAEYGQWWFCEAKVPCFVLTDSCKSKIDGHYCRDLLAEYSVKKYMRLYWDSEGDDPVSAADFSDGCNLPTRCSDPNTDGQYKTLYNWKEKFCFSSDIDTVLDPDTPFECPEYTFSDPDCP